jgi:hypothetical protein
MQGKYIEMDVQLCLFFMELKKKEIGTYDVYKNDSDYKRGGIVSIEEGIESLYYECYANIKKNCESIIMLLSQEQITPDLDNDIRRLNLEIYKSFVMINQTLPPCYNFVIDLLPNAYKAAYKLIETFNQHAFKTQHTDLLNELKFLLKSDMAQFDLNKGKFSNENELLFHQCLNVFSIYAKLLTQSFASPGIFTKGSTLASDIRSIMKNMFDIELPVKLNDKMELVVKLSSSFRELTKTTHSDLVINSTTSAEFPSFLKKS